ncbi:adenylate/guanylate cyclase domain-containing protein [Ruegeria sp. HKCCA5014]|uniref:adenylate/guanylate cyclase domain-containing protein n=1 Tax=Ruegeria sp. HKCCA5014 TaxID=2682980 RepID=UPI001489DDDC|nr:adenylate/guanylate cyclase domain-containing protein [Ruegeria sp. HKCCA5014]
MRSAAVALNAAFPDQPGYRLRIALNSGDAFGGTLGARGSMKYNVIGDTINVAARLESYNKSLTPDADGFPGICMTLEAACLIDPERDWLVLTEYLHDNGRTNIDVIEVPFSGINSGNAASLESGSQPVEP